MNTLTRSGAGVVADPGRIGGADSAAYLTDLLDEHRFVVIKRALDSLEAAVELMRRFGPINEAKTRKDGAVMVEEKKERDEVFRSRFALPLHKDGVLTGFDVVLVGIYCVDFEEIVGGRTYVSDAMRALGGVPPEYVEALRQNGMEALALDSTGYYRPEYEGRWHPFPAFKAKPGQEATLNVGLQHAEGEPASWRVRVANLEEEVSDRILASLRGALLREDYTYFHDWEVGDILLMDNYRVLHGREAFEGRKRQLANIQVLASGPPHGNG